MENKEIKENFCGACMILPFAFAGAGSVGLSQYDAKKKKKRMLLLSIGLTLLSFAIYFWWNSMYCDTCNVKL